MKSVLPLNIRHTIYFFFLTLFVFVTNQCFAQLNCNSADGSTYDATTGFQEWTFDHIGVAGHFSGDATTNGDGDSNLDGDISVNSNAFGLWANGSGEANQFSNFDIPFISGDKISLDMDNGYVDTGGSVGFGLLNAAGENLFELFFEGGDTYYSIDDLNGITASTIPFTDEGLSISILLNTDTEATLTIISLDTDSITSTTIELKAPLGGQEIKQIHLYNDNAGNGTAYNLFFNNIEVCQSTTDIDNDGWFSTLDCDDTNASINPGETEILFNDIDDDCNPETPDYNSGISEMSVTLDQSYLVEGNNYGSEYFYAQDFGSFYCGDSLLLNGAQCKTFKCTQNENADITSATFHYRVFKYQETPGSFISINMPLISNDGVNFGCQDQTWGLDDLGIDLLQNLDDGVYIFEVYTAAEFTYTNGTGTHTTIDELQNFGVAQFTIEPDNNRPEAKCQDFNLLLDETGQGILEISDINDGSTDNCEIVSMSLSKDTFTCADIPTAPFTADELIISEYVSDLGNNNYIELFNGTPDTIDLSDYELRLYFNAMTTPFVTDNLGAAGLLPPDQTAVFGCPNSYSYTGPHTVLPNYSLAFQGAETLELFNTNTQERVDLFGSIGEYPLSGWVVGGISATHKTLRRLPSVTEGNINAPQGFPTLGTEWTQHSTGDISGLGNHTFNYNTGAPSHGIKLYVFDESGNRGVCTSKVTIEIPLPNVVCKNIVVALDANGEAIVQPEEVNDGSTATCGNLNFSLSQTFFDCSNVGENPVVLTATDENTLSNTCTTTVTVVDTIAPIVQCQDISIQLDENGGASISAEDIDNGSTDNCGIASLVAAPLNFDINDLGENTVTLTATDIHGNTSICQATITVNLPAPQAICADYILALDSEGQATLAASDIDGGSTAIAGISNLNVSPSFFDCQSLGDTTVTLTVTDTYGLSSSCQSTISIVDLESPTAICHDILVLLDQNGEATISPNQINSGSYDNCGIADISLSKSTFNCSDFGVNSTLMTVTDFAGNSSTCTATVNVIDNIAPVALGQNITISLDDSGEAHITPAQLNNGSYDNCQIANISISQTEFDCNHLGDNMVTLTVTDVFGNHSSAYPIVTVVDETPPSLTCHSINKGLNFFGTAQISAINFITEASDNCDIATLEITNGPTSFDCSDERRTYTIEITATDWSGNQTTCTSSVHILSGIDMDSDGISDACDLCYGDNSYGDANGDGICDSNIFSPTQDGLTHQIDSQTYSSLESILNVWPNPTSNDLSIRVTAMSTQQIAIEMYSISGRHLSTLYQGELTQGSSYTKRINMREYENGIYFIKLVESNNVQTQKIVLAR